MGFNSGFKELNVRAVSRMVGAVESHLFTF